MRPFINCRGNATAIGGSIMPEPVLEAMRQAAGSFVALETLQERIGERLARRIGVEGALVSCGAASGVQQAAAACLTGTDAERVQRLPYTDGWRNRFVIPQVDVHDYIFQVIAAVGGVLVKVGSKESCPTSAIEAALDDDTAAVVHYLGKQTLAQLAEVVAVAEPRGIPVIVDAAAQLPPRSNLTEPVRLGAGLVVFSGGKGLRGPQSSGLVVGKAKLIEAARMNGSPASSVGRGMKVGKEELMGLLAAVELFLDGSDQEDYRRWRADAELIVAGLEGIDGVRASVDDGDELFFPGGVPRVRIELLGQRTADAYGAPAPRRRAQHLHGRLGRRNVRRPHDAPARRGRTRRPPPQRSLRARPFYSPTSHHLPMTHLPSLPSSSALPRLPTPSPPIATPPSDRQPPQPLRVSSSARTTPYRRPSTKPRSLPIPSCPPTVICVPAPQSSHD